MTQGYAWSPACRARCAQTKGPVSAHPYTSVCDVRRRARPSAHGITAAPASAFHVPMVSARMVLTCTYTYECWRAAAGIARREPLDAAVHRPSSVNMLLLHRTAEGRSPSPLPVQRDWSSAWSSFSNFFFNTRLRPFFLWGRLGDGRVHGRCAKSTCGCMANSPCECMAGVPTRRANGRELHGRCPVGHAVPHGFCVGGAGKTSQKYYR
jgi:hypothetical protein